MALPDGTTDHVVRPLLHPHRHRRRPDRDHRSVVREPDEPDRRPMPSTAATCCSSRTATSTTSATPLALASRLRPAWPCIHELSLWLARRLPGGGDAVDRHEQGRHGRGGRAAGHDGRGGSLGRRLERGRRDDALPRRPGRRSSSSSRTATASTTPATRRSSPTCSLIRELYRPDLAMLPIGGHFTMDPDGSGPRGRVPRRQGRRPAALRHVPDPDRHAGAAARGARGARPGRRARPRAAPGRFARLDERWSAAPPSERRRSVSASGRGSDAVDVIESAIALEALDSRGTPTVACACDSRAAPRARPWRPRARRPEPTRRTNFATGCPLGSSGTP